MQRWQCHKIVEAGKILSIDTVEKLDADCGNISTSLVKFTVKIERGTEDVYVGYEYMDKFNPEVGGYIVKYEDGYLSYSPAKPFEDGYKKVRYDLETDSKAKEAHTGQSSRLRNR